MEGEQFSVLAVYLPLTAVVVILDHLLPGMAGLNYFKFAVMLSLFPAALLKGKGYREQFIMTLAVFFMVVGDFFLNLCRTIPQLAGDVRILGALSFLLAYLSLLWVFARGGRAGLEKYLAAVPVLAVALPAGLPIIPYLGGEVLIGALVFACVLCTMAWAAICTLFKGYYSQAVSRRFALAGYLILISDIGVAHAAFNPAFAPHFVPWLQDIVWGAYIPAWALIVANIAEERLLD